MSYATIRPSLLGVPDYLATLSDAGFPGTQIQRICGVTGVQIPGIGGVWAQDSRHHYAKDQPWDDAGKLLWIEQKSTYPTKLILDAQTLAPLVGNRGTSRVSRLLDECYECRWRPGYAGQMVGWNKATQELLLFDPVADSEAWRVKIPGDPSLGWLSEGTISDDGRWTCLATSMPTPQSSGRRDYVIVVDLERRRVGPPSDVGMFTCSPYRNTSQGTLGNVNISTRGNFVYGKLEGTPEYGFILQVNKADLTAIPRIMAADGLRMFETQDDRSGWVACLSHADANEFRNGRECVIGGVRDIDASNVGSSDAEKRQGSIVAIDCATGQHEHIGLGSDYTGGVEVAGDQHTSGRAYQLRMRGTPYHLVTYSSVHENANTPGRACIDEMQLVPTDGSRAVIRLGVTRTDDSAYRAEAHGVPSPDGSAVCYASNWQSNANPTGASLTDIKSYLVRRTDATVPPVVVGERYQAQAAWVMQGAVMDTQSGRLLDIWTIAKKFNEHPE